jgi:hypothetical protein
MKTQLEAQGKPAGHTEDSQDCYDQNQAVNPKSEGWFAAHRGDGSFDYNCSKAEEKRLPSAGACGALPGCAVTQGWLGSIPACGQAGAWIDRCELKATAILGGKCVEVTSPKTQECH